MLFRVKCQDVIITNEIYLFDLSRVEDECKMQNDLWSKYYDIVMMMF